MLGMDDTEPPLVRIRVKPGNVGDLGTVGSATSDALRACTPPNVGPAVLAVAAVMPGPNARERAVESGGESGRVGAGFESNRIVLGVEPVSS
jgi:hypothetical protein